MRARRDDWFGGPRTRHLQVVRALLIREMMTRYGRRNIGFLWLVAEPLVLIFGIILVWSIAKGPLTHGVSVVPFALTGYGMLTLWRHQVMRCLSCPREVAPLLFHRGVGLLDALLARFVLELFGTLLAVTLAYLVLVLFDLCEAARDPLVVLLAWGWMGVFAFGTGLCLAGLTMLVEGLERFVAPLMYLALPLSGAFTLAAWLSQPARELLLLSPLVHATEMLRAGFMGERHVFHFDLGYLAGCTILVLIAGVALTLAAERRYQHP